MKEKCAILSNPNFNLSNYNEIYLDNTISNLDVRVGKGWIDQEGVKVNTWEINQNLDRTSDVNCLNEWKKNVQNKFYRNKDLNIDKLQTNINQLKFNIKDYERSINSVRDLEKSKRHYQNTRLEHMNLEMEMERKMNKKLLDDFVKRARQERIQLQDEFDRRLNKVDDQHDRDLTEQDRKHRTNIKSLNNQFETNIDDIKDKFKTIIGNRDNTINKLSANSNDMESKYMSILETANTINEQKQINFDTLVDINKSNSTKYNNVYNDNLRLEQVARNAHNVLVGEDIKAKINEDMYLINRIQNNRENFTNKKDETYFLYLLLSLGLVTALVLFKK